MGFASVVGKLRTDQNGKLLEGRMITAPALSKVISRRAVSFCRRYIGNLKGKERVVKVADSGI